MTRSRFFSCLCLALIVATTAATAQSTRVPGHQQAKYDQDNNGYPDAGVIVTGKYTSVYAYDANEDYYWDLGDGRIYATVGSVDELDATTRTVCDYQIQYRGDFNNNPGQDSGWIINNILCKGFDAPNKGAFVYLMVHKSDPRYTGNPEWALWGNWEYHVLTVAGQGNLVRKPLTGPGL